MPNCRRMLGVAALLITTAAPAAEADDLPRSTPAAEGLSAEKLAEVGEVMSRLVDERHIAGGQVMIARHGKVVFDEVYGQRDLDAGLPIEHDTIFRIYSMSKAITSAAAMMLVDEGKLDVDAPVGKYLPELAETAVIDGDRVRPAEQPLTVADLFLHTSGIPYGSKWGTLTEHLMHAEGVLDRDSSLAAMATKLSKIPLEFDPGTNWKYGAGIDLLGRVVEVAGGMPLDQFFAERIFEPLGMTDTAFYVPADKQPRFATNYAPNEEGGLNVLDPADKSPYLTKPGLFSGGGGLVGTVPDYMRFLLMVQAGGEWQGQRLLSAESIEKMTTNQVPDQAGWVTFGDQVRTGISYGLGFSVTTTADAGRVDEYGWGGAASTHYWVSPRDGLIVVTMEQRMPYSSETEDLVKPIVYGAIVE